MTTAASRILDKLERDECRFPVNDDRPMLFCGAPTDRGQAYCPKHWKRAFWKRAQE